MFLTIKLFAHAKLNIFKIELFICIKMHLALNNLQRLICHKTQTNQQTTDSIRNKNYKKKQETSKITWKQ